MALVRSLRGNSPKIDGSACLAETAVIEGDVTLGPGTCVLHGAVVSAQGAPVAIGRNCIVMEQAVIRGAGAQACRIGDHVLIGPHAHVSGADIGNGVFVATGAVVMNGASLDRGTVVQIHAVVHIGVVCPAETVIPIGHVAIGNPVVVLPAHELLERGDLSADIGFTAFVFGFDSTGQTSFEATRELCRRYSAGLARQMKPSDV